MLSVPPRSLSRLAKTWVLQGEQEALAISVHNLEPMRLHKNCEELVCHSSHISETPCDPMRHRAV